MFDFIDTKLLPKFCQKRHAEWTYKTTSGKFGTKILIISVNLGNYKIFSSKVDINYIRLLLRIF